MLRLPPGRKPPEEIYVFVEIPANSNVKYEYDDELGVIAVDRVLYTALVYPFNYGFIPSTLSEDGDPLDVALLSGAEFAPGVLVRARPIGLLEMEDEEGTDYKVIAVPIEKVDPSYADVKDIMDLTKPTLEKIRHFFERYKELEPGKWVKAKGYLGAEEAKKYIMEAVERFKRSQGSTP
ncbi:inorganic diphosphatase [Thermoproteus tenax]|uniref:Inorganic pyrophosphatase n=2 Tax=Thermoproteus tenax TaxID=2271 RepID=G4RNB5_THETK|nr:inorganic diphosphatase [Thermoproteus tenax]CAP46804.1 inorganic pyrophosphatase [Thermoproteus tenax Kra 1]CCC81059.1 Inorganic pyrophosphatase [Thermoproteus tenax Kra 1]